MSKSYQLLAEYSHVSKNCPPGIYLIPVPKKLQSPTNSPSTSPRPRPISRPVSRINIESKTLPWHGVIFIRNAKSPYFQGTFRFEINFATFSQIRQYLQPSTAPTNRPYSYDFYPIIQLTSEIHTTDNYESRIAEYCLDGIEDAENDAIAQELPFSRVLHALTRLQGWFDGTDVAHDEHLASTDVKVSNSDTLLYESARSDHGRIITFTPDDVSHDVRTIVHSIHR